MSRTALSRNTSGGRGPSRAHRLLRRGLLSLTVLAGLGSSTACATKADIRDVREDLTRMEARQDSIYRLLQTQNRQILDSLTVTTERLLNVRGELARQLTQLNDQVVQLSELTGQVQIRLNQLDQELAGALQSLQDAGGGSAAGGTPGAGPPAGGAPAGGAPGGTYDEAEEIYQAGLEQVRLENAATARRAFQMVVDSYPDHPLAPEAQRQLGEAYAMEGQYDRALRAFERVVERYQDSSSAPRALYRAGVIAQERGQLERAREYFRRVISGYPNSDARRLAEDALDRIG